MKLKKLISPLMLLGAAAIWGFAFSAQKSASDIPSATQCAIRCVIAFFFLLLLIPIFDKTSKSGRHLFRKKLVFLDFTKAEWIGGACCGFMLALGSVLQQLGMETGTDAGKCAFITALYVVLVPLIGFPFGNRPPKRLLIAVPVAVLGFYFLCLGETFSLAPSDLLVLLCAVAYAAHILVIDHFSPNVDGVRMSAVQLLAAAFFSGIYALIFDAPVPPSVLGGDVLALLYLGICSSGIAYTFQILGQKGTDPAISSVLLSLESVFGVVGAAILLGERMSGRELFGCIFVFLAVLIAEIDFAAMLKNRKTKTTPDTPPDPKS